MYATKQSFGGQKASIGRVVVVKLYDDLYSGVIEEITENDAPKILVLLPRDHFDTYTFADVKTEADIESVPDGSWFWPPRV